MSLELNISALKLFNIHQKKTVVKLEDPDISKASMHLPALQLTGLNIHSSHQDG